MRTAADRAGRQECGAASNGQEPLRPRAGGGYRLVSVQPASSHPGPARPSDDDDAGPLCLLRHLGQHQTIALVRLSGRQDLVQISRLRFFTEELRSRLCTDGRSWLLAVGDGRPVAKAATDKGIE